MFMFVDRYDGRKKKNIGLWPTNESHGPTFWVKYDNARPALNEDLFDVNAKLSELFVNSSLWLNKTRFLWNVSTFQSLTRSRACTQIISGKIISDEKTTKLLSRNHLFAVFAHPIRILSHRVTSTSPHASFVWEHPFVLALFISFLFVPSNLVPIELLMRKILRFWPFYMVIFSGLLWNRNLF